MNNWISVDARLPPVGVDVLVVYRNEANKPRIIRAQWVTKFAVEAEPDLDEIGEFNEADNTYYLPEGWWEQIDNWEDYCQVYVSRNTVTHWCPMPNLPE